MDVQVKKPSAREIEDMAGWPVWEKEPSSFDWSYSDRETCYFLEGDVEVELPDGNSVRIQKGDVAVFPQGLNCRWVVRSKVRKHYKFG